MIWVPPGGVAAISQQTPAAKAAMGLMRAARGAPATRKRRAKAKRAKSGGKRRSSGRKLKFGSPAWRKKYMKGGKRKRK